MNESLKSLPFQTILKISKHSSWVIVVFDLSASLKAITPAFVIMLSVAMKEEKNDSLTYFFVFLLPFVITSQIEFSECCV